MNPDLKEKIKNYAINIAITLGLDVAKHYIMKGVKWLKNKICR